MSVVVDDYIKDRIILDSKEFADPSFWESKGSFWYNPDNPPQTRMQELVYTLWEPFITSREIPFAGFEYWSAVLRKGRTLEAHRDRDEKLFSDTGKEQFPIVGSVYYPIIKDVTGGELLIYKEGSQEELLDKIQPKQNRMVFFESGKLWHKVSQIGSGERVHFAVNVWKQEPYGLGKEGGISVELSSLARREVQT